MSMNEIKFYVSQEFDEKGTMHCVYEAKIFSNEKEIKSIKSYSFKMMILALETFCANYKIKEN